MDADNSTSNNVGTLVFKLEYMGKNFLFTGDVTRTGEAKIVNTYGDTLQINFFKACHHGSSSTSNSENFITGVFNGVPNDSRYAMISSGRRAFSGTFLPNIDTIATLKKQMDVTHIFSTAAGDFNKEEEDASRDDNILIVVKNDGSSYICYSGTN